MIPWIAAALLCWPGQPAQGLLLAAAPAAAPSVQLGGSAVYASAPRPTLFLATARGIEAVDALTGATLWRAPGAAQPVLNRDGKLLLAGGRVLDAARGEELFAVADMPRPEAGPGLAASATAVQAGAEDQVVVAWSYRQCAGGQYRRTPPPPARPSQEVPVRIDWNARRAVPVAQVPPQPAQGFTPRPGGGAAFSTTTAQGETATWESAPGRDLVLRPPRGKEAPVMSARGHASIWAGPTADRQTLLVVAERAGDGQPRFDVAGFDLGTGAPRGGCAVEGAPFPSGFVIQGSVLIYYENRGASAPDSMAALDLASCRRLYQHDVANPVGPEPCPNVP